MPRQRAKLIRASEPYGAPRNPRGKRTPSIPKLKLGPTITAARRKHEKRFAERKFAD